MNMPITITPLADRMPGRLHVALQGLETDPSWADRLEQDLSRLPGLHHVCASITSGNLLLRYDPDHWDTNRIAQAIGSSLGRPWYLGVLRSTRPCPVGHTAINTAPDAVLVRELCVDGQILSMSESLPPWAQQGMWRQADVNPVRLGLRIGILCYPGSEPDGLSLAFRQLAGHLGMPVADWIQQYPRWGNSAQMDAEGFTLSYHRRGHYTTALIRGEPVGVLKHCAFYQDRQGCHPLNDVLREKLSGCTSEMESRGLHSIALAYRPLLFRQHGTTPTESWILVALAGVG